MIAQYLTHAHPGSARHCDLGKLFSTVASTSRYCWSYIFAPCVYDNELVEWGDGVSLKLADVYLEAALLVACGYGIDEVKRGLRACGRMGGLQGYRQDERISWGRGWVGSSKRGYDCPSVHGRCMCLERRGEAGG